MQWAWENENTMVPGCSKRMLGVNANLKFVHRDKDRQGRVY